MAGRLPSDPDAAACDLASKIYEAGRRHGGIPLQDCIFPETKYTDPDSLADAIINLGCRELQAHDMQAHGNRMRRGSLGSQAQSVMERLHHQPEPRAAQLVRQRVHEEWMRCDEHLIRLADKVIKIGLAEEAAEAPHDPEAAARRVLDVARRRLAAAEGNHVTSGGDAAEVDAAFDTFDPPIRRHALADIVLRRLQRSSGGAKVEHMDSVPEGTVEAEA